MHGTDTCHRLRDEAHGDCRERPVASDRRGLDTVDTKGLEAWLAKYFASEDVSTIVVGKPSRMDGTPSETWRFIEPLAVRLRKAWPDKEVVFHDERFTSVMAHRTMLESGIGKMARRDKALVDKISATIILQSYMEFNK